MEMKTWNAVGRRFRNSDNSWAIQFLEVRLAAQKTKRFKGLLNRNFTNPPRRIHSAINRFIAACAKKYAIKAVYLEMNGFDINPDGWYFDFFGYSKRGSKVSDLEWLCNWEPPPWPEVVLKGLESVQADFKWYHAKEIWQDHDFDRVYDLAVLLVMCKFVSLIEASLATGPLVKSIPVLATAHDFDIVGRFNP